MSLVGRTNTITRGSVSWADGDTNKSVDLTDMTDPTEEPIITLSVSDNQSVYVYAVVHDGVHWTFKVGRSVNVGALTGYWTVIASKPKITL